MHYDMIGDLHGHADSLKALLHKLGYRERHRAWCHTDRQAIFLGDFIDRGPQQVETVNLVRAMVEAGSAQAVMGNHEFNAIAWFLPDPDQPNDSLRSHTSPTYGETNRRQHQAFLREVEKTPQHKLCIDWFLTLPLWLDLPELRVVHACWHPRYMDYLTPSLSADRQLDAQLMVAASREPEDEAEKDNPDATVFKAVETLLKGIEIPLPSSLTFKDKDGHERSRVRVRWWDADAVTYRQAAMLSDEEREGLPDQMIPEHVRLGHDGEKPLFVGHYWLTGTPQPLSDTVACVDYSIAKGGKLVAYRWEGESVLNPAHFHWVAA